MSNVIDSKVVEAKFDGSQFEKGVQVTLSAMASLKHGLKLDGATTGLRGISQSLVDVQKTAGKGIDLSGMTADVQKAESQFSGMSLAAIAGIAAIVSASAAAGAAIVKNLSIDQILDGFSDYELKIGATQTIMAGTGEGIGKVTKHLKELDIYADQTIYSLSDMVSNIGKFTNAGVKLPVAVNAMKGISNVAAISGASAGEAARAMYNLGQAIGQGTVRLMDWRSVELANMGTKEFKEQLIQSGVAMGTLTKAADGTITTAQGTEVTFKNFTATLQDQWLTSEALTETLGRYADANTAIGKKGYKAATQVKTMSMMFETLKAAAGTGWTDTFDTVIGTLPQATKMWSSLTETIGGAIGRSADARNKMLGDWAELGGRKVAIDAIKEAWGALMSVIDPIRDAFREIFPKKTGEDLYNITVAVRDFFENLKIGADTAELIKGAFEGFFAAIQIGWDFLKALGSAIGDLFSSLFEGSGGFLETASGIGEFVIGLRDALREGETFKRFFDGLVSILAVPLGILKVVGRVIAGLFGNFDVGEAETAKNAVSKIGDTFGRIEGAGKKVMDFFGRLGDALGTIGSKIGDALTKIGDAIAGAFTADTFSQALDVVNTGLIAGMLLIIKKFFSGDIFKIDLGQGLFEKIGSAFGELTNTMKAMQQQIKADAILRIAIALAVLAGALFVLSTIDPNDLTKALIGMGIGFAGLQISLASLSKVMGKFGSLKLPLIAAGLTALAVAVLALAVALKIFASISIGDTLQGLIAMTGTLTIAVTAMKLLSKDSSGMLRAAAAMTALGIALNLMATALKIFSSMDYASIARGLVAMAGSLLIVVAAMTSLPGPTMVASAAGLVLVGVALNAIAAAMKVMATISWAEIARVLVLMTGSLLILSAALDSMMLSLPGAAGLAVAAAALVILAGAFKVMATISWAEIARVLVLMAGALAILAAGLTLMIAALPGAAALLVAAGALAVLAPVLVVLGNLSWGEIAKALAALAGAFVVLGVAGYLLAPLTPILIGLGLAMTLVGAGLALAGVGAFLFATAFTMVVATGQAGMKTLGQVLATFVKAIPGAIKAFAMGIILFVKEITKAGPEFTKAFITIVESLLEAGIKNIPKFGDLILKMLDTGLKVFSQVNPKIVAAGLEFIDNFLQGVSKNIDDIVEHATDIIVKFLTAIGENQPRINRAGVDMVVEFINGTAETIRTRSDDVAAAAVNLGTAIVEGAVRGLLTIHTQLAEAAANMARNAWRAAMDAIGAKSPSKEFEKVGKYAGQGFVKGLVGSKEEVEASWNLMRDLLRSAMQGAKDDINRLAEKLKELKKAKNQDLDKIRETEHALARARAEYNATNGALDEMNGRLEKKRDRLKELGAEYDRYTAKIQRARQALQDAIQTRDDYSNSVETQFSDLPDITQDTSLEQFLQDMKYANADINKFQTVLQELRDMGLSDALYEEFLAKGPSILPFLEELNEGGERGVVALNNMSRALAREAKDLGETASTELYQAGVDAAQGLLDGLRDQRGEIAAEMKKIAKALIKALKDELKIKSPSHVMRQVGEFVVEGLASGIVSSAPLVEKATEMVGNTAIDTLRGSIASISDRLAFDMDLVPTITPVLDLSSVRRDSTEIGSLLSAQQVAIESTYSRARYASSGYQENRAAEYKTATPESEMAPGDVTFIQNNTSPKALSSAEIYRQTKNQLSKAKGALTHVA